MASRPAEERTRREGIYKVHVKMELYCLHGNTVLHCLGQNIANSLKKDSDELKRLASGSNSEYLF